MELTQQQRELLEPHTHTLNILAKHIDELKEITNGSSLGLCYATMEVLNSRTDAGERYDAKTAIMEFLFPDAGDPTYPIEVTEDELREHFGDETVEKWLQDEAVVDSMAQDTWGDTLFTWGVILTDDGAQWMWGDNPYGRKRCAAFDQLVLLLEEYK